MITRIKKSWIILLTILLSLTLLVGIYLYKFRFESGQMASSEGVSPVLEINSTKDYLEFANDVNQGNAYAGWLVRLCKDLDFSGEDLFVTAGASGENILAFAGTFDGQGHTISGITNENPAGSAGLFANLTGIVKNLRLEDCAFSGSTCGAICSSGTGEAAILNCQLTNVATGNGTCLMASDFSGNIWNCLTGDSTLTLSFKKGTIEHCYYPDDAGTYTLIQNKEEIISLDSSAVCEALNQNLSVVSGCFSDLKLNRWSGTNGPELTNDTADLVEALTAAVEFGGQSLTMEGYYSFLDRCWIIALPAKHQGAALDLTVRTTDGHTEKFRRSQDEETVLYTWNDTYYPIRFFSADNIDTLYVTLRAGRTLDYVHSHKLDEIPGVLTVFHTDGSSSNEILRSFYGHGNDSWASSKKSYNIKLDTPTNFLGMGKNEDFALLAGNRGNSLMNYCVTTELSNALGFPYAPQYRLVNLYVNGAYLGVYFLAEKIELDINRIEIDNLYEKTAQSNNQTLEMFEMKSWKDENSYAERYWYDIPKNPEDITGGYLLEADIMDYGPDESRFVSERKIPFTLKRFRQASEAEMNYIADFWQDFEDALFADDGYNDLDKHYTEYIDVESFAMQWLTYELVQEASMSSSIYFYKESDVTGDGLLHACFPWDMEHSYAYTEYLNDIWMLTEKDDTLYGLWSVWYKHDDFREELARVWKEKFLPTLEHMLAEEPSGTDDYIHNLSWFEANIDQLDKLESGRWRKMLPLKKCATIRDFLKTRREVLTEEFLK